MVFKKYLICLLCNPVKQLASIDEFSRHIFRQHGHQPQYTCASCKHNVVHKTSFVRHLRSVHEGGSDESDNHEDNQGADGQGEPAACRAQSLPQVSEPSSSGSCSELVSDPIANFDIKTMVFHFLMDLRSSGNMTNTSVQFIMENVQSLLSSIMTNAANQTEEFLEMGGISRNESGPFIERTFKINSVFEGLMTVEEQINQISAKFGMVIPEEKYLGSRIENRFDRSQRMFLPSQISETFQYVSLIGTLTLIVRNSFLRGLIEAEEQSKDGILRGYVDGSDFALNAFLQKYPKTIRISLYEDDLEIANALGSKDVIHKLGGFYISIQNFPPEESSILSSIFLLILTYAEDLKKPGALSRVFTSLQEELKVLMSDDGVVVDLPEGGTYVLRACLVCFCADSLAAHQLLGFLAPSGADKFCRICMISKNDFAEDSTAMGELRTSAMHRQQVDLVEADPKCSTLYGVKCKSLLIDMMRVPEDSALDAFHDLVGVIHMDIKLALYEFICVRKLFKTHEFNSYINMFDYGLPSVKNKPSPNIMYDRLCDKGHTLKQNGSQTFCLLNIFPFIIKGVDENDPYLQLIFLLQDIVKILFSFEIRLSDIERLENLICEHNRLFHQTLIASEEVLRQINPGEENNDEVEEGEEEEEEVEAQEENRPRRRARESRKLKKGINKLHHLAHYPQMLREKGPAIRLWCARFEGRHRIFKKHSGVQSNFKNMPKTMARMFQLSTVGAVVFRTGPREVKVFRSGAISYEVRTSPYQDLLLAYGLGDNEDIQIAQSVEVHGEQYCCGLFVALKHSSVHPVFGLIMDIIVRAGACCEVILVVCKCKNYGLSGRYNAYRIKNNFDEGAQLISVKDLANHRPIATWSPITAVGETVLYLYPRTVDI